MNPKPQHNARILLPGVFDLTDVGLGSGGRKCRKDEQALNPARKGLRRAF